MNNYKIIATKNDKNREAFRVSAREKLERYGKEKTEKLIGIVNSLKIEEV